MTGAITASARVEVDASGRCTTLRSQPPLTFRQTAPGEVHAIGTAAGPVGGDRLRVELSVAPGGSLVVRGVAASLVHPGPTGASSSLDVEVDVAAGAALCWLPQPTVLIDGCDHTVTTTIRLGVGARLTWYEPIALGRHGEPSGSLLQRLRVDLDGRPLLRTESALGPRWPGAAGPAGTDGATVFATRVTVDDLFSRRQAHLDGGSGAAKDVQTSVVEFAPGCDLMTALAPSFTALGRALGLVPGTGTDGTPMADVTSPFMRPGRRTAVTRPPS